MGTNIHFPARTVCVKAECPSDLLNEWRIVHVLSFMQRSDQNGFQILCRLVQDYIHDKTVQSPELGQFAKG